MTKYEARVKTEFGEVVFNFDTVEELRSSVEALDTGSTSEIFRQKFKFLVTTETRKPKPDFEKLYGFTSSGLVEIAHVPDALTKPEIIAFVLFAYHPEAASTQKISFSSGVKGVTDYLTQTSYKKLWWKTQDGDYVLSDEGLKWVTSRVLPKLVKTSGTREETQASQTKGPSSKL